MPQRKIITIATAPIAVMVICQPAARFLSGRGAVTRGRFRTVSFSKELMFDHSNQRRLRRVQAPERSCCKTIGANYCALPCDGAGVAGRGEVVPEPVVLGALRGGVLLVVVVVEEPLLAVLLLLFHPAMIRKPMSSRTATPAIQPHIPPALSSRRNTGSLSRGSLYRGSVKRGSVMTSSLHSGRDFLVSNEGNPRAVAAVPLTSA
jgi:hypothetical protein